MTTVELCVHMCCPGCEARIRKSLAKLRGVDTVDVDMPLQKVTVTGYADQKKVLKAVRKSGRRAVLWPNYSGSFDQQLYNRNRHHAANYSAGVVVNPFAYSTASSSSYNYRKHGYDESIVHGYYGMPASYGGIVGERAGAMFSDDNPNACSIM